MNKAMFQDVLLLGPFYWRVLSRESVLLVRLCLSGWQLIIVCWKVHQILFLIGKPQGSTSAGSNNASWLCCWKSYLKHRKNFTTFPVKNGNESSLILPLILDGILRLEGVLYLIPFTHGANDPLPRIHKRPSGRVSVSCRKNPQEQTRMPMLRLIKPRLSSVGDVLCKLHNKSWFCRAVFSSISG